MVRDVVTWARYFLHPNDCVTGELPEIHARVFYDPDETGDPRGPRARAVSLLEAPAAAIWQACRDCGIDFETDAGLQAWLTYKALALPTRCEGCRSARRAQKAYKAWRAEAPAPKPS
jgi:hypothetical protein